MAEPKETELDQTDLDAALEFEGDDEGEVTFEDLLEDSPGVDSIIAERDDYKDRLLRSLAELENVRKRAERDRRDAETYGGVRLARDLLSVYDNMGRALDCIDESLRQQQPALIEGIELTQKELLEAFRKNKIEIVTPEVGEKFDPQRHQAMFEAPIPGQPKGAIFQVMAVGFVIGERLLRPAHVGVSSGGAAAAPAPDTSDEA